MILTDGRRIAQPFGRRTPWNRAFCNDIMSLFPFVTRLGSGVAAWMAFKG